MKGGEKVTDFNRLYENNYRFILRYLTKLCADGSLAEELTQDTFFKAYINFNQLRDESKAATWLCSIAKNAYYAWYREQKRTLPLEDHAAVNEADLAEPLIDRELSKALMKKLHALDEPYKEVFMLTVFAEMPLKEISELFGKSESWARVTFYRAKKKLSERLNENDEM